MQFNFKYGYRVTKLSQTPQCQDKIEISCIQVKLLLKKITMSDSKYTNELLNSNHTVVEALFNAVVHGDIDEDMFALFQTTDTFNDVFLNWKHPNLQINIFQLAIIYKRNLLVQFLGLRCPGFHNERERYRFPITTSEDIGEEILINCPLHLACWVGSLEILKYLLTNSTSFSLNDVSVLTLKQRYGKDFIFEKSLSALNQGKKPLEVCIAEKHVNCAIYVLDNFVISFAYLCDAGLEGQSSPLHKACSIGCGPLVLLLLESLPESVIHLTDSAGKTPLHVAVWNGDSETLGHLLKHGADPNVACKTKSCLHIMYRSYFKIHRIVENTALLIKFGMNVNMVDDAGNSALHVLADLLQNNIFTTQSLMSGRAQYASREFTTSAVSVSSEDYSLDLYCKDITECLQLLISNGADVTVKNSVGCTAFQILVDVTCLSSGLNEPLIYKAADVLLDDKSPVTWSCFIPTQLTHDVTRRDKIKLVTLLCQHGRDVDQREITKDVLAESCYPVLLSIQNRVDVPCVQLILNYMSHSHLQKAMNTICKSVLPQLRSRDPADDYLAQLETVVVGAVQVRTLRHLCKVVILVNLGRRPERCRALPVPQILKNYLMSAEF